MCFKCASLLPWCIFASELGSWKMKSNHTTELFWGHTLCSFFCVVNLGYIGQDINPKWQAHRSGLLNLISSVCQLGNRWELSLHPQCSARVRSRKLGSCCSWRIGLAGLHPKRDAELPWILHSLYAELASKAAILKNPSLSVISIRKKEQVLLQLPSCHLQKSKICSVIS